MQEVGHGNASGWRLVGVFRSMEVLGDFVEER